MHPRSSLSTLPGIVPPSAANIAGPPAAAVEQVHRIEELARAVKRRRSLPVPDPAPVAEPVPDLAG